MKETTRSLLILTGCAMALGALLFSTRNASGIYKKIPITCGSYSDEDPVNRYIKLYKSFDDGNLALDGDHNDVPCERQLEEYENYKYTGN